MSVLNLLCIFLVLNRVESIYVAEPNGTNTATVNRAGIKTLTWQSTHRPQNVTFHHNYSRVYTHQPNQPVYNYTYVTRTLTQSGGARRPQYDVSSASGQTGNVRIPKNNIYTIQNANLYEFNPNSSSQISINDHLEGFSDHVISQNSTLETLDQHSNINDHLSGEFAQINSNFVRAAKPQRLTSNLQVTPHQHSKYKAEKIEIFKTCPKGATGQFVYELSCNQFLNCWKGKGYAQNCPPGTLFNPKTSECDFSHKVRCITGPREVALKEREPLTAAIQARCPAGFTGIIPHYTDCSKFINCHNGAEFIMDCAPGTLFDIKSNNCDYPHRALCVGTDNLAHKHPASFGQQPRGDKTVTVQGYNRNVTYELRPQGFTRQNQRITINNQLGEFEDAQSGRDARFYSSNIGRGTNNLQSTNQGVHTTHREENQLYWLNPVYIGPESEISNFGQQNTKSTTHTSPKCPAGASGIFPHPTICEKFLNCANGQTFIQDCGPGTVFNPKFKVCDYPYNVDCHSKSPSEIYTSTDRPDDLNRNYRMVAGLNEAYSMGLSKDYCSNRKGYSIYPQNCSRFIYCSDSGEIFIGVCEEDMYYDPSRGICRENIDCKALANQFGKRETWHANQQYDKFRLVEIGGEMHSLGLTRTYCQHNLGFTKHPIDCNKFLLCTNDGQILLGICNQNFFFDPSKKACDQSYRCGQYNQAGSYQVGQRFERYRLESIGNELTQLGLDNANGEFCRLNPGFTAHFLNCSKFLICTDDLRVLLGVCNPNMFYDPIRKICDYNSNCHQVQQSGSNGDIPQRGYQKNVQYERFRTADIYGELHILRLDRNYCQNHLGFSVHPYDCTKFLLCNPDGKLLLGICNPNTFYDPTTGACTAIANCGHIQRGNRVENQQNFRLVEAGNEINVLGLDMNYCGLNNGFSSHPKNCSRFLLCQNGKLFLGICHQGLYYNPVSKVCESNYRCGQKSLGRYQWENQQFGIYSDNAEISRLSLGNDYCNIHDGFSQYPGDCAKFLYCKYGRLYIGACKPSLVYNQKLKTCDSTTTCRKDNILQSTIVDCHTKTSGLYPHPTTCSKFVNCVNGAANTYDCAAGTVFNPASKVCDFPHKVDCSRSGIIGNHEEQNAQWTQGGQNIDQGSYDQHSSNQWGNAYDQDQNNEWVDQYDQKNQGNEGGNTFEGQNNRFDQENSNQWTGIGQDNSWNQNQNYWLTTTASTPSEDSTTVWTYDQNKKPSTRWPPPFPSTDPNADYVFEVNDLVEAVVPTGAFKQLCTENDFHCTKDTCIDRVKVCDGSSDCPDGEDEKNCETYIEQFTHLSSTKMAVKEKVRFNNVTLTLCAKYCVESNNFTCKAFNFRKMDGTCFLLETNVGLSGSLFILPTYDYYEYKKHSIDCSNRYKCPNQKCIDEQQICNGINDCFDWYDEKGCTAEELGYSIRLIGSEKSYEGAVEVTALGKTGLVCDDMFSIEAANIVCKELGFDLGAAEIKKNSHFLPYLNPNRSLFIMDDVVCTGNEASIRDCDFSGWGISNCMEKEAVGVVCKIPNELCAHDMWKCQTVNECVPSTFICDGVNDCSDDSDEATQFCEAPIEMRLADGKHPGEGRVEIKHHGTWGTICDDDFNEDAGKVVCRFLGYNGPARVKKEAYFGAGEGPIWLDQVFCQGNESSLEHCIRWDWGVHNCEHNEDVGLICDDYANEGTPRNLVLPEETTESVLPEGRCGYRNDDIFLENDEVHFRVVKGAVAQKGHYPWQASIKVKGRSKPSHWCGAVVISSKFVLTAAHCLYGFTKGAYIVVAGDYDVNEDEGTEQQAYIEEFYIHEHFRQITKMNNDVALVRLKGNGFNITRDVQPICLPPADFSDEVGMNCTISGFGSVHSGRAVASKELRAGWIPIQPAEVCKMPHVYGKSITDGMFCAGPLDGGIDACDGDSGGPLACLHEGHFTLIGMTSWGQHCGEANKPGVYVKIAHYRNWIDDMMIKHA